MCPGLGLAGAAAGQCAGSCAPPGEVRGQRPALLARAEVEGRADRAADGGLSPQAFPLRRGPQRQRRQQLCVSEFCAVGALEAHVSRAGCFQYAGLVYTRLKDLSEN